jgi:type IV pilus assembly protein PilC
MPKFRYTARDASGKRVTETRDAASPEDLKTSLTKNGLTVLSVAAAGPGPDQAASGDKVKRKRTPWAHVSSQDLVIFTRQFSTMISAGIPVLECLDILSEQATDPGFKHVLNTIIEDVRGGTDLSNALARHHRIFDKIYINMVKAGEASGQLDEILTRLAEYKESTEKLKGQIRGAMTYPVISIALILVIFFFLMLFVIPKFSEIFKQLDVPLPLVTKVVLGLSDGIKEYYIQGAIVIVILSVLFVVWKRTESGALIWDRLKLKTPVFGSLFQKVALSRFSRTFATLIRSGVPMLGALEIVSATAGNRVIERAVEDAHEAVRQGEPLAKPLAQAWVFPPMVVRMISIGEKSGALEQLLEKISQFYDEQVAASVEVLTSLIEPIMIGFMGLLVGGIVIAVFYPILMLQKTLIQKR